MSEQHQTLLAAVGKAVGEDSSLWRDFERLLRHGNGSEFDSFLDEVDDSDYSLADWVEAFVEFDRWLDRKGTALRPLTGMRGYIHCCTLMNPALISSPNLKVIVFKSLTEFGFDAVSEAQN